VYRLVPSTKQTRPREEVSGQRRFAVSKFPSLCFYSMDYCIVSNGDRVAFLSSNKEPVFIFYRAERAFLFWAVSYPSWAWVFFFIVAWS
jgi:hypothetical protein